MALNETCSRELIDDIHRMDTDSLVNLMFDLCSKNINDISEEDTVTKGIISRELRVRDFQPEVLCV